jgi:type II secretory pathway pseudopilin PulG
MIKFNLKNNKGFTLLEALVAISILMVAVSAPITIAQKGLSSAVYSKDQMLASYLAQDAIEYIKNQRDYVSINNEGSDWEDLSIFVKPINSTCLNNSCDIDTITGNIRPFVIGSTFLKKDGNKFYGNSLGDDTKFARKIKITLPAVVDGDENEALVTVTVTWGTDPNNKVEVNTLIYNY